MARPLSEMLLRRPHQRGPELDFRQQSFALFQQLGLPHRRMDQWKYVNSDFLMESRFVQRRNKDPFQLSITAGKVCLSYNAAPTARTHTPAGLTLGHLPSELLQFDALEQESNIYALINGFTFERAWDIGLDGRIAQLQLNFSSRREEYLAPRLRFNLAADQRATVLLNWQGLSAGSYCNALLEFNLQRDSRLVLIDCAGSSDLALQNTSIRCTLASGAQLQATTLISQPQLLIHDTRVDLAGRNASVDLGGLALLCDEQKLHLHTTVNHLVGPTCSRQLYKNILFDRARSEFTGLVYAAPRADGTDANLQNRNLLLSKWAHALARPQLNINAEDLQCRHGSSTGGLADEEIFYLQTRGIAPALGRSLLTEGFAQEVLQRLPQGVEVPDYQGQIRSALNRAEVC